MEFLDGLHLHPMLVHFPIALFVSALVFELLYLLLKKEFLHQAALTVYVLAVCLAPLAVLTGLREADELHLKHPVLDIHRRFALSALWISLASLPVFWLAHRKSKKLFNALFFGTLLAVVACVCVAAYNGGRLVYEYGVGVEK